MKIYATKYALTAGIKEHDAEIYGAIAVVKVNGWISSYFHKGDWHTSMDAASKRAEEMRIKKVASLKKQIIALEEMKF